MAKKKKKPDPELLPAKEVTVKSHAYGVHTRASRGSQTPVKLNDAFREHVSKTAAVNGTAKRVHDLLKVAGAGFKEAMLWQKMLSRMRKGASDSVEDLLITLEGMELNEKYPLRRFTGRVLPQVKPGKDTLAVSLPALSPTYNKSSDTQYGCELWLLALGKKEKDDALLKRESVWMDKEAAPKEIEFVFAMPAKMKHYLLCLHFMSGNEGKATGTLASRGMGVVGVGNVKEKG